MRRRRSEPVGVILAGGEGRRIGGAKAVVQLCGRPLISYPLAAMRAALTDVIVVAKADTALPGLPGVTVWVETSAIQHPLVGIIEALEAVPGRSVLICAGDLPFVTPEVIRELAGVDPRGAPAVVASIDGATQPLFGVYLPAAQRPLADALRSTSISLRDAVRALSPRIHELSDPRLLFNVNAPEDLLRAAAMIDASRT